MNNVLLFKIYQRLILQKKIQYSLIYKRFYLSVFLTGSFPASIYMFKVSNGNSRTMCQNFSKLKKPGIYNVNF